MQIRELQHSIIHETFVSHTAQSHQARAEVQLGPIHHAEVPEIDHRRAAFRVLRGSAGKQTTLGSTRVRTVLTPGLLGNYQRQVMVHGLTRASSSCSQSTRDYFAIEGSLDVEVGKTLYRLSAGDRLVVPRGLPAQVVGGDIDNKIVVSFINGGTREKTPTHLARVNQPEINSPFCGKLRNTLFQGMIENTDQVMAEGLTHSIGHVHQQFAEDYLVVRGSIRLALFDGTGIEVVELHEGDRVIMPAGTGHKVLGGSDDNQILVTCTPGFRANDEMVCEALESFGRAQAA